MTAQDAPLELAPLPAPKPPRTWKFWGTSLWGLFAFAALFLGQVTVVVYVILFKDAPFDLTLLTRTLSNGTAIAMSVIMGLPAVCAALWLATRLARIPFADYLALNGTPWKNYVIGAATQNAITSSHSAAQTAGSPMITDSAIAVPLDSVRVSSERSNGASLIRIR